MSKPNLSLEQRADKGYAYFINGELCATCRDCGNSYEWDYLEDASYDDIQEAYKFQPQVYCFCCERRLL